MNEPTSHSGGAHAEVGHHVPLWVLGATLIALLVLTVITVAVTQVDFGSTLNVWVAMIIATVKATLVALYFMHLRYDRPISALILVAALVFVMLFVSLAMMDSLMYQENVESWRLEDPTRYAPELHTP